MSIDLGWVVLKLLARGHYSYETPNFFIPIDAVGETNSNLYLMGGSVTMEFTDIQTKGQTNFVARYTLFINKRQNKIFGQKLWFGKVNQWTAVHTVFVIRQNV